MSQYAGVSCPVCGRKFVERDDIVVCPQCGAPHHRSCYEANRACAFAHEHTTGKEWKNPDAEGPSFSSGSVACQRCGGANPADAIFCQICGTKLNPEQAEEGHRRQTASTAWGGFGIFENPYDRVPRDGVIGGESVADIVSFVGPNSRYYLLHFQAINDGHMMISFNLAAFFFNFLYFFYRKMYRIGSLLLALSILCLIPQFLYYEMTQSYQSGLGSGSVIGMEYYNLVAALNVLARIVAVALNILVPLFGNRIYYHHVLRSISSIKATFENVDSVEYHQALFQKGHVSKSAPIIVICALFFVCFGVMLANPGIAEMFL